MPRAVAVAVLLFTLRATAQSPAPQIQNGKVETRPSTALDREVATIVAGSSAEPVWAAWKVPIVDGQRGSCSTYSSDNYFVRGEYLENGPFFNGQFTPMAPTAGAVQIEAPTELVVLVRAIEGKIERLRAVGGDCPLDAGGRTVYWLQGVKPADSITYLETLMRPMTGVTATLEQRLNSSAMSAIALHRDPTADVILDRLALADADTSLRRSARSSLASARGAHGFAVLKQLVDSERLPEIRRQLVGNLGTTRQAGTADALLQIAKRDTDAKVRAEAAYWLPQRGGQRGVADVVAIITSDTHDSVKQRAVQGLARLPGEESIPALLQLARTTSNPVVKKEAVTALGRSKDPRAVAYMESLLR